MRMSAALVADSAVSVMAEVFGHLGIQPLLDQQLRQLLEQALLADQVLRRLVFGQQAVEQLLGYVVFPLAYGVSGLRGSLLPEARLHKSGTRSLEAAF